MQRRVPQEFVDVWDAWLQESLHATRRRLGERWLAAYLTSPIWRFVLAEGVCDGSPHAGVMVPSVDRVGRYFPLTILAPLAVGSCVLEIACGAGRSWFDAAERLALGALEASDLDLDAFDAEVEALEAFDARSELAQSSRLMELMARSAFASGGSQWHISMPGETPQRAANAFASIELERAFRPCALWWTQGSDAIGPGWLVTRGLPAPASFAAMLSGEWREVGWSSIELAPQDARAGVSGASEAPARAVDDPVGTPAAGATLRTAPMLEITAAHPQPARDPGADSEPRFVTRPEIGLWGVIRLEDGPSLLGANSAQPGGLDLIADSAHDLAPQATLTVLVEETRRMLQRARAFTGGPATTRGGACAALFFLAQGSECALVWIGAMQAVRVRGGTAVPVLADESEGKFAAPSGTAFPSSPDGPLELQSATGSPGGGEGSLLALLTTVAPVKEPTEVAVRYERLEGDDLWLLGTAAAFAEGHVCEVAAAAYEEARGGGDAQSALDRLLSRCLADAIGGAKPAVMVLTARTVA